MSYIVENKISFVIWSENDWTCRRVLPYLVEGKELESEIGRLTPIKKDKSGIIVYKYASKR